MQAALEFMSYVDHKKIYMTLKGLKTFSISTKSGMLGEKAYPGQDKQVIKKTIDRRRKMAIDAVTNGLSLLSGETSSLAPASVGEPQQPQAGEGGIPNDVPSGEDCGISDEGSSSHSHESNCRFYELQRENKRLQAEKDAMQAELDAMKKNATQPATEQSRKRKCMTPVEDEAAEAQPTTQGDLSPRSMRSRELDRRWDNKKQVYIDPLEILPTDSVDERWRKIYLTSNPRERMCKRMNYRDMCQEDHERMAERWHYEDLFLLADETHYSGANCRKATILRDLSVIGLKRMKEEGRSTKYMEYHDPSVGPDGKVAESILEEDPDTRRIYFIHGW